jgi:PAS domain S-box-containing protein
MPHISPDSKEPFVWSLLIGILTILLFTGLFLHGFPTDNSVISHLFYILIVIVTWFFPVAGFIYTVAVASGYAVCESQWTSSPSDMASTLFRAVIFVIIGGIISLLSYRLRCHEKRVDTILTHIQSGVIRISGPDARITYSNPAAVSLFNPPDGVLNGKSLYDLIFERSLLKQFQVSCKTGNGNECHEMRLRISDNINQWIALSGFHEDDESALVTITDLRERRKMEQDLSLGKIFQKTLLDSIPEVVWLADSAGNLLTVNRQCHEFAQKPEESLTGMQVEELYGSQSAVKLHDAIRDALVTRETITYDEIVNRDGKLSQFETTIIPIFNPDGETTNIAGVIRDVTEQQELFTRIREQEEMLRIVLDGLPIAALVIDADHTVRYVNQALSMLMERDVSDLIGTKNHPLLFYDTLSHPLLCDLMLEEEVDIALESWHEGKYNPSPTVPGAFEVTDFVPTRDLDRWMRFTTARLVDEQGRIIGAIETCEDFSSQREIAEAIRVSEERFKIASEIATDLIFEYDKDSGLLQWFGDVDCRLGYEPGEVVHTLDTWLSLLHDEDRDRLSSKMRGHLLTGEKVEDEMRIRHKWGGYLNWQIKAVAMYDLNEQHHKTVGIITDVSMIREIENAKKSALLAIEQNIEQFAILGDHIRNPLQAIAGYNDLQGGDYAEKISFQISKVNEIVDRLDRGWIESESIREFLRRHYGLEANSGKKSY